MHGHKHSVRPRRVVGSRHSTTHFRTSVIFTLSLRTTRYAGVGIFPAGSAFCSAVAMMSLYPR